MLFLQLCMIMRCVCNYCNTISTFVYAIRTEDNEDTFFSSLGILHCNTAQSNNNAAATPQVNRISSLL